MQIGMIEQRPKNGKTIPLIIFEKAELKVVRFFKSFSSSGEIPKIAIFLWITMADGSRNYTSRRYKLEDNSLGHDKFRVRLSSTNIFSEQFSKVYHNYIGIIKQNQRRILFIY